MNGLGGYVDDFKSGLLFGGLNRQIPDGNRVRRFKVGKRRGEGEQKKTSESHIAFRIYPAGADVKGYAATFGRIRSGAEVEPPNFPAVPP